MMRETTGRLAIIMAVIRVLNISDSCREIPLK